MRLTATVLESFTAFCDRFHLPLYPHQRADFGEALKRKAGRFVYPMAGVSWPRGDGKTHCLAEAGLWRLLCGARDIISVALDEDGARVTLAHARALVRAHPDLTRAIEIRANALLVPATGATWTVESREHTSTRGRHPDVVLYDETGWAKDSELFAALLSGQASVPDPLMLVASTVGRLQQGPLWTIKTLAEGGDPSVCWRWSGENRSPLVTREFLERQRRILLPGQYGREHLNTWLDGADAFVTAGAVDGALGRDGWTEGFHGQPGTLYAYFVDLGLVHDPTVIGIGHADGTQVYVDRLYTFQGSREAPVQVADVERALVALAERFPPLKIRVESWQGMGAVQRLSALGLPVEIFTPTAKTNAEEWPLLAQALTAGTLTCYPHSRLREELLNLSYEVGPQGIKVTDRGKVHQDHAVCVRGLVAMLAPSSTQASCADYASGFSLGLRSTYRDEELDGYTPSYRAPGTSGGIPRDNPFNRILG